MVGVEPAASPTPAGTAPTTAPTSSGFGAEAAVKAVADSIAGALAEAGGGKKEDAARLVDVVQDLFGFGPLADARRRESDRRAAEARQLRLIALGSVAVVLLLLALRYQKKGGS